jgi:hypothetical protein
MLLRAAATTDESSMPRRRIDMEMDIAFLQKAYAG